MAGIEWSFEEDDTVDVLTHGIVTEEFDPDEVDIPLNVRTKFLDKDY